MLSLQCIKTYELWTFYIRDSNQYKFFKEIIGEAMLIHRKYKPGLLESAYEAALKYLLELKGYKVKRQVFLPILLG